MSRLNVFGLQEREDVRFRSYALLVRNNLTVALISPLKNDLLETWDACPSARNRSKFTNTITTVLRLRL